MKSRYSAFMLWASIMAGIGGGHRRADYILDEKDVYRMAFAQARRERRALKRYRSHVECVANNPCYKEHKSCVSL